MPIPVRCLAGPSIGLASRGNGARPPSVPASSVGAPVPLRAAPPAAPAAPTVSSSSDIPALERAFEAGDANTGRLLPLAAGERVSPLTEGEARPAEFASTPAHRAWVGAGTLGLLAVYGRALGGLDGGALDAASLAAATVAGYYAAGV